LLEIVEMTEYADVKTKDLSGGQQGGKSFGMRSQDSLDEPFSHIDFRKNALRTICLPT
jgi:ABC-type Mn2+/Zn2+ transport system ATPase subunit